jgi:hypothetical protein
MLGYLCKGNKPDFLKDWHMAKIGSNMGTIYHLATYEGPQVLLPKQEDLIPTDVPGVSAFKIKETLDPSKHFRKQPVLYGSLQHAIELADGQRWVIPRLRICPTADHELESRYFKDAKGERFDVVAKHKEVHALGDIIFKSLTARDMPEDFNPIDALARLLSVNYCIGTLEVGAFGLFSRSNFWNIVGPHVIDLQTWVEFAEASDDSKKND